MRPSSSLLLRAASAGALLLAVLAPAHAQYSWLDAKGTRVFSDRPPPPGTPAARILKAPRAAAAPPYGAPENTAPPPAAAAPKPARPSIAEQEADFKKRATERQQAEHKAGQELQRKADQDARCKSLQREQATMAAGTRLSEFDEKGERRYIAAAERAARLEQARNAQMTECR